MRKWKLLNLISTTPFLITPLLTGCSSYSPDTSFTPVHDFINDRTFSICQVNKTGDQSRVFGTMWLLYHEKNSSKASNSYTYYALTNNHVTSAFNEQEKPSDCGVYFAYQNQLSAISDDVLVNNTSFGWKSAGKENVYNSFSSYDEGTTKNECFKPLFTTYVRSNQWSTYPYYDHYSDLTLVKVDFGNYAGTDLATNRLNRLNYYADQHDNMLVPLDDFSDISSTKNKFSIYCGGYPLAYMDDDSNYIYDNHSTKFQAIKFDDCKPEYADNINQLINNADESAKTELDQQEQPTIYNANNQKASYGFLHSPDWVGKKITKKKTPFGGGASGSLAIRCSDENDSSTYKLAGIYWGGMETTKGKWYFEPHLTPFILNFGKNLPSSSSYQWNIFKAFLESSAFTTNTPTDYSMYEG